MLDPQKQSELIAAKSKEVSDALFIRIMTIGPNIESAKKEVIDAIHGAVASGYLLCLQTLQQVETEMKNDVSENVRGM